MGMIANYKQTTDKKLNKLNKLIKHLLDKY